MVVTTVDGALQIEPAVKLVENLAGSVDVPERFKGLDPDEIIKQAKKEYFSKK